MSRDAGRVAHGFAGSTQDTASHCDTSHVQQRAILPMLMLGATRAEGGSIRARGGRPQPACRMNESCRLCPLGRPPRDVRVDLSCLTQNNCLHLRCSGSASIAAPVHTCVLLEPCFPIPASHVLLAHFIKMGYCTAMTCPSACCRSWFPQALPVSLWPV